MHTYRQCSIIIYAIVLLFLPPFDCVFSVSLLQGSILWLSWTDKCIEQILYAKNTTSSIHIERAHKRAKCRDFDNINGSNCPQTSMHFIEGHIIPELFSIETCIQRIITVYTVAYLISLVWTHSHQTIHVYIDIGKLWNM